MRPKGGRSGFADPWTDCIGQFRGVNSAAGRFIDADLIFRVLYEQLPVLFPPQALFY